MVGMAAIKQKEFSIGYHRSKFSAKGTASTSGKNANKPSYCLLTNRHPTSS